MLDESLYINHITTTAAYQCNCPSMSNMYLRFCGFFLLDLAGVSATPDESQLEARAECLTFSVERTNLPVSQPIRFIY